MRFITKLTFLLLATIFLGQTFVAQNRVKYNNQQLFLSGANLAWVNFANDIGPGNTNYDSFAETMLQMHDHGGNALRWWLHTNGTASPQFNDTGLVVGPGAGTIEDIRKVLDLAWEREIGVKLCLWSFDMLRSGQNAISAVALARNKKLLLDTSYTRAYINNCLIPMVDSLKDHPAILAWEIFNEPEGMSNEFGFNGVVNVPDRVPMSVIQRFINLCAGAIHRVDPALQVTNGAWSFYALTDTPTLSLAKTNLELSQLTIAEKEDMEKRYALKYGAFLKADDIIQQMKNAASQANFNYYSDSRLIAVGGDSLGKLDFYSVHYYDWGGIAISPFHHPKGYWGLNKSLVVAEFAMKTTFGIASAKLFDTLYQIGYAGALPWSWTDVAFSTHADMLAGMQSMWNNHKTDVDVHGISGDWPVITIMSPKSDTTFADSADVTITAVASDPDGAIALVEFFVDDTLKIGECDTLPFSFIWKKVKRGAYALTAIATDDSGLQRVSNRVPVKVGKPLMTRFEAEAASRSGPGMTIGSDNTASKGAYVNIASNDSATKVTWQFTNLSAAGNYEIVFGYKLFYQSPKSQFININGVRIGELEFTAASATTWYEKPMNVNLVQGVNTIQIQMFWGWMYVDYLAVPANIITSVENSSRIPLRFSLQQNYPNPFNPATTIRYSIPSFEHVKLTVFDMLGREITKLVDENQSAGSYSVPFGFTKFASGVYFYKIEAGRFIQTKKMVLLK